MGAPSQYTTYSEALALLKAWEAQHSALQSLQTQTFTIFGGNPDGIFFNTLWTTFDAYTHALAKLLECEQNHPEIVSDLHWYWHENGMGKKKLGASKHAGKQHPIDSIEALASLIAQ